MAAKAFCPACGQLLECERGYLPTHMTDLQRGQLVTGSKVCDMSNKKIITELATVEYAHECEHCGVETTMKVTENYPGQMESRKAWIEIDCFGCSISHDGYYCGNQGCGLEVKDKPIHWLLSYPDSKEVGEFLTWAEAEQHQRDWMAAHPTPAGAPLNISTPSQGLQLGQITNLLGQLTGGGGGGGGDEPVIVEREAGWYDLHGDKHCSSDDPFAPDEHVGVFKQEFHRIVKVTDGHVIQEEPDEEREAVNG